MLSSIDITTTLLQSLEQGGASSRWFSLVQWQSFPPLLFFLLFILVCNGIYNRYFHPLRQFPGPFWGSVTDFYKIYLIATKHISTYEMELHHKYGRNYIATISHGQRTLLMCLQKCRPYSPDGAQSFGLQRFKDDTSSIQQVCRQRRFLQSWRDGRVGSYIPDTEARGSCSQAKDHCSIGASAQICEKVDSLHSDRIGTGCSFRCETCQP